MNSPRIRTAALPLAAALCMLGMARPAAADYIDSINPAATPTDFVTLGFNSEGWYYTPTQTYTLTGISTFFAYTEYGTGARTVTVQISTDRPVDNGVLLDQGTFTASGTDEVVRGASFAQSLQLTAGVTYFVDFLNVAGLGSNFGQYQTVNGVDVASGGATTRLAAEYQGYGNDFSFATSYSGNGADESSGYGDLSKVEPILYFSGYSPSAVPEPGSLILLATGLCGLAAYRRKRRPKVGPGGR